MKDYKKFSTSIFSHDMWVFSSLAWFGTGVLPFVFVYEHACYNDVSEIKED